MTASCMPKKIFMSLLGGQISLCCRFNCNNIILNIQNIWWITNLWRNCNIELGSNTLDLPYGFSRWRLNLSAMSSPHDHIHFMIQHTGTNGATNHSITNKQTIEYRECIVTTKAKHYVTLSMCHFSKQIWPDLALPAPPHIQRITFTELNLQLHTNKEGKGYL